jgi:hypothetical protein
MESDGFAGATFRGAISYVAGSRPVAASVVAGMGHGDEWVDDAEIRFAEAGCFVDSSDVVSYHRITLAHHFTSGRDLNFDWAAKGFVLTLIQRRYRYKMR